MMKFACSSFITPGETWQDKFSNLEKLGFDGIEIRLLGELSEQDNQIDEIVNIASKSSIKPSSLVRPTPAFLKELTQDTIAEKIDDAAKIVEYAHKLNAQAIISLGVFVQPKLPSPFFPLPGLDNNKLSLVKSFLSQVGEMATKADANLVVEPLNRFEGSYFRRLGEPVDILEELGNQNLGILADVFHINIEESNTEQAILNAGAWIKHVQLGDNNRLLPGEGQFNFVPFLNALKQIRYSGYMAFECIAPMGEFTPLSNALSFLKTKLKELD